MSFVSAFALKIFLWTYLAIALPLDGRNKTIENGTISTPIITLREIVSAGVTVLEASIDNDIETDKILMTNWTAAFLWKLKTETEEMKIENGTDTKGILIKTTKSLSKKFKLKTKPAIDNSEGSENKFKIQRQATNTTTTAVTETTKCQVFELLEGVAEFSKGVLKFVALGVPEEDDEE